MPQIDITDKDLTQPQPQPISNTRPAVWDLVIEDMRRRDDFGAHKYHTRLKPFNGRVALVDAYQEALDLVVYIRQKIAEEDILMQRLLEAEQELRDLKIKVQRLDKKE